MDVLPTVVVLPSVGGWKSIVKTDEMTSGRLDTAEIEIVGSVPMMGDPAGAELVGSVGEVYAFRLLRSSLLVPTLISPLDAEWEGAFSWVRTPCFEVRVGEVMEAAVKEDGVSGI